MVWNERFMFTTNLLCLEPMNSLKSNFHICKTKRLEKRKGKTRLRNCGGEKKETRFGTHSTSVIFACATHYWCVRHQFNADIVSTAIWKWCAVLWWWWWISFALWFVYCRKLYVVKQFRYEFGWTEHDSANTTKWNFICSFDGLN